MNRVQQRLQGLGATILLIVLVVGVPTVLIAIGAAPWHADLDELRTLLTSSDDGTLALVVFAVVAWIAWAVMAVCVVVETAAQVRGITAPPIPGIALPQRAAGQLVAVAALLFVAAPPLVSGFPSAPVHAATAAPVLHEARGAAVTAAPVPTLARAPVPTAAPDTHEETVDYTVKRGDSLWKIAEHRLGDGARYKEIVDLNRHVLDGRPDFIVAGTVLRVPHADAPQDEDGRTSETYVVRTGDTLADIAQRTLGDPSRYTEIFAASRSTVQPDGAHLNDPDLIQPGWTLTIPAAAPVGHHPVEPPDNDEPPADVGPPDQPPVAQPTPEATPGTTTEPPSSVDSNDTTRDNTNDVADEASPGWLLPGLTGAGAVLAGTVLLAVRAHRRTQLRYRRPGQTIAPPPPEPVRAERTAHVSGAPLVEAIGHLDRLLRHLAATVEAEGRALPVLAEAVLERATVTLRLAEAAELPSPWEGEGSTWAAPLDDTVPDADQIPPYPMLVTVGQDDTGRLHLINLEQLRAVTLTGKPAAALALARHVAAELALNPWSVHVEVDLVGVGEELATLDPSRLRHHTSGRTVVEQIAAELRDVEQVGLGDPDPFRVAITTSPGDATRLTAILSSATSRLGAAVIALDTSLVRGSAAVEMTTDGRLRVPDLDLDLVAAGLTSKEAAACAAIVDLTRDSAAVLMPTFTQAADGWRAFTDQAGALREELTNARGDGPVGDDSLLPHAAEAYTEVAATTAADVEALAPIVPEQVRRSVEEADLTLDEDVAAWFSQACPLPRLALLGPVDAVVPAPTQPAIIKRKPYFVELLAYLALHPAGKTGNAVADAFSISSSRARTDLGHLRGWLDTNPNTGRLHLPLAAASRTYENTGVKTYQVEDVLVDVDLFRRLRARGEARGADGIGDLTTALRLVRGLPFDYLRERGWSWLLDDDRLHETIGSAIVDTAHIVVLDAMANSDLATARKAAETACRAAPYDDICRLDLVKVAASEGQGEAADQMLTDDVFNRTDDHLPPIDLPARTGEVVGKQGWGSTRRTDRQ